MDIKEFEQKVHELVSDKDFLYLIQSREKENFFDAIGNSRREEWHSGFVKWLLNPKSNHGLGDFPLKCFLSLYNIKYQEQLKTNMEEFSDGIMDLKYIYNMDLCDTNLLTERSTKNGAGRMDIVGMKEDDFIFVIENKIDSNEHLCDATGNWQTEEYFLEICRNYKEYKKYFIYLYYQGDEAKDKHFVNITYQELFDYVISPCLEHPQITNAGYVFLENYSNSLGGSDDAKRIVYINKKRCSILWDKYKDVIIFAKKEVEKIDEKDKNRLASYLYNQYNQTLNEILLSTGNCKIQIEKPSDLVAELIHRGVIIPGDENKGEFLYRNGEIEFEVDVLQRNGQIYFVSGYFIENQCFKVETEAGLCEYKTMNSAISAAISLYNKENNDRKYNINALRDLKRREDNKNCNELWDKCIGLSINNEE